MEPEKQEPAAHKSFFSLSNKPAIKLFIGGLLGTIPFAFMRGHAQYKNIQSKSPDTEDNAAAENSFPMRLKQWSQKYLKMDEATSQTYTEFAYSFFTFLTGLFYIKPLLDRIFPDTPKKDSHAPSKQPDANLVETATHAARQAGQFAMRLPIASALALIPYAFSGFALSKTLFAKRTDADGNEKPRSGVDAMINSPFNGLLLKIGLMFSTFNIAYHYCNKLLDKVIGPRHPEPEAKQKKPEKQQEKPSFFKKIFTEARDLLSGIILPVMTAVTPLVSIFYFSNRKTFQKQKSPEDMNLIDKMQDALFSVGDAGRKLAENVGEKIFPQVLADKTGLDEKGIKHVSHAMLYMPLAYGAYAFTRHYTNDVFKNLLGHSSKEESKKSAPPQQPHDATLRQNATIVTPERSPA